MIENFNIRNTGVVCFYFLIEYMSRGRFHDRDFPYFSNPLFQLPLVSKLFDPLPLNQGFFYLERTIFVPSLVQCRRIQAAHHSLDSVLL